MKLSLCTLNPTVGDLPGNRRLIETAIAEAARSGVDLLVLPELVTCGYPPRDLLLHPGFDAACFEAARVAGATAPDSMTVLIGSPAPSSTGAGTANTVVACRGGKVIDVYEKQLLPTYDVFDEARYFVPGTRPVVIEAAGQRVGLVICEDLWKGEDAGTSARYRDQPDPVAAIEGACDLVVSLSAAPFVEHKHAAHLELLQNRARRHRVRVASVNQLGANDDLIFTGHRALIGADGEPIATSYAFDASPLIVDTDAETRGRAADHILAMDPDELLFRSLVLGVRDYCRKTRLGRAVIGLSGGIDSAVTAAIAVAALGADCVTGVLMPSAISSAGSVTDAEALARNLGIKSATIPIASAVDADSDMLNSAFDALGVERLGKPSPDVTLENLQSRVRGLTIMAVSNRLGAIVLTTGNKSELAVGYCTLYGDMNGGLAVLSDVLKTRVYELARWMNRSTEAAGFSSPPIPTPTIEKPPSAELAPDQRDDDTLPPYEVLDEIVRRTVEKRQSADIIEDETHFSRSDIDRVRRLITLNEFKRYQAAVGLKVSPVAFGSGRRMPLAGAGW